MALRALPVLAKTVDNAGSAIKPHLVIVASEAHELAKLPQQDASNMIAAMSAKETASPMDSYNASKVLDVMIAREMAKLSIAGKVSVTSVNPGFCKSDLRKDLPYPVAV